MEILNRLLEYGISESSINHMRDINFLIDDVTIEEFDDVVEILEKLNCSKNQIINIISSNSLILSKSSGDLIELIEFLNSCGFLNLNILFDSNPYIFNLEVFEIRKYIDNELVNNKVLEDIVDELESNVLLFNEM